MRRPTVECRPRNQPCLKPQPKPITNMPPKTDTPTKPTATTALENQARDQGSNKPKQDPRVLAKIKAGLTLKQAEEVIAAQDEHDAKLKSSK